MENKFFQVVCIKDCESLAGIKFLKNKIYKCRTMNNSCYIYDNDNEPGLRIEINPEYHHEKFSKYFMTLQEYRKLKIEKINESRR